MWNHATIPIRPFRIAHSAQQIADLKTLLRLSPLGPETYENGPDRAANYGISMRSMRDVRDAWLTYDWEATQERLNTLPQYIARVPSRDPSSGKETQLDIHFLGYESGKPGAVPVLLLHGWPGMGCFELAPMVDHLRKHSALPLDIIIPRSVPSVAFQPVSALTIHAVYQDTCTRPLRLRTPNSGLKPLRR